MPRLSLPSVHLLLCHSPRRAGGPAGPPAHVEARCLPPVPRMSLPSDRLLFHQRTGREAGLPAPTVSLREASTGEARCGLQPVSSSVTQRAAAEQGRAPTVSRHEVWTVEARCLPPVSFSVTHRAAGASPASHLQCHGTRCPASGLSPDLSLTGRGDGFVQYHCTRCRLCLCAASSQLFPCIPSGL